MRGDSAVSVGDEITLQAEPKAFRIGSLVIGSCGGVAWEACLRRLRVPRAAQGDLGAWLETDVSQAIRATVKDNEIDVTDCEALLAVGGLLYRVEGDGYPWRTRGRYAAIGSGAGPALGSLRETIRLTPPNRLKRALEAATEHTNSVRPPFPAAVCT
jgi:hypothetical protein